ncbi:MAG: hypothetical protein ACOCVZ_05605 [Gemmatimonadota bacterium]
MAETDRNPAADSEAAYDPTPVVRDEHSEATLTRLVEQQTARIPSHWFLVASFASMGAALGFEIAGRHRWSRFIGMWAPTLLITGVYNKLVKALGPR